MVRFEKMCWFLIALDVKKTIRDSQTSHNYRPLVWFQNLQGRVPGHSVWRQGVLAVIVTSNICIRHGLLAPLASAFFPLLVCSYA